MAAKAPPSTSLCLLLLYLFLFFASEVASQTPSNNGQKRILLQIKQDWGDEPALSSWNDTTSSPYCNWTGVVCAADGSVVSLTLSWETGPTISGPIPSSLCDLENLTSLDLGHNSIPGPFPTSLYRCSGLQYLDLSQNCFVGAIPDDVYRLSPRLTYLDLSGNNFTGDIPRSIGRLPGTLQVLWLHQNLFNGSFPAEIGNLSGLQQLLLAYNPFAPMSIPSEFGNLTQLTYLWMSHTNIRGEIPDSFARLKRLEQLDLTCNSLTGAIPAGIWGLPNLQLLYLYSNNLSSIVINATIGALGLVTIDVSTNQLTGPIPAAFGKLKNLSILFMYYNQLSGEIPPSIGLLPSLTDLRLFNNGLRGILPPELGKHSSLWNIEVDDNMLSGELPDGLCNRGALTSVVVFNNKMTGKIPPSLGECPKLDNIQIYRNQFSGEVPDGIWSAKNLTTVTMNDNALSGTLPDKLPWNLTRLDISNNRFTGGVPSSASELLVFLASNNMLSGKLPSSLTGIPRLQRLNLGGNMITGGIPEDISSLKLLTDLNLSHNQLTGDIPGSIGTLPVLTSLDLSANQLTGSIPSEMGNLKLNHLNLSSNQLSGQIPAKLQSLAYDQSFLSNSGLCASKSNLNVPTCPSRSAGSNGLAPGLRILFLVLGALVFLMALAFSISVFRDYRKKRDGNDFVTWKLTSFQSLDFTESTILRGMTEDNLIGSGGAGCVYKIILGNRAGQIVAVKKICNGRKLDSRLEKQFLAEVQILGSIRHRNIVKLLCCISSPDSKLLVYEYMENGSLDRWLHGRRSAANGATTCAGAPRRDQPLDWPTRLEIAIGSARGLSYMHHDCSPPIIHRDVKSSNILLDSEFHARVADFGLARMLVKPGEPDTVTVIAGSFGYMAPECGYSRRLNEKVDVYSFGVVLLELTTGRVANNDSEHCNLAEWSWRHLQEGAKPSDAVDPAIRDSPYIDDIATVFKLGIICTETLPSRRPSMKEVLQILLLCNRPGAVDCNPSAEQDAAAPLLRTNMGRGSRRQKPPNSDGDGDGSGLVCNV